MRANPPPYPKGRDILSGKTVLVTASAGTGIGYATAMRCAEEGATVMLSDIHPGRLQQYADELQARTGKEVYRQLCNVRSNAEVSELVRVAIEKMGRLDVLVNNAGLGGTVDLVDTSDEHWNNVLDINLNGTFRCMRAVLPIMALQGGGAIINMSSICAWRAERGQTAYAASKAAILALTRCAAVEAAADNIRINAVVPSLALHPYLEKVSDAEFLQQLIQQNEVFGRAAEPWEIGNAVVFLASDYASYMTGEALSVSCRHP